MIFENILFLPDAVRLHRLNHAVGDTEIEASVVSWLKYAPARVKFAEKKARDMPRPVIQFPANDNSSNEENA